MNVLILTSHLNAGGITRYIFNLAKGLQSQGHRVFVASSGGSWEKRFVDAGVRLVTVPLDTKAIFSLKVVRSFFALRRFLSENKIEMMHGNTRVSQFLGFLLWQTQKIPYVCTFHGYYKPHFFRRMLKCQGLLTIAISYNVKEHMVNDLNLMEKRIRVIYHGVDGDDYRWGLSKEDLKTKHHIHGSPVIGIVARFSPEKNHKTLIAAFQLFLRSYPKALLVFLGEGRLESVLKSLVKEKGLVEDVVFLKNLRAGEVVPCFDVSVMPSSKEGFGLSVLEAMVLGIPVIVSGVGGLNEIVEHRRTGVVLRDFSDREELCGSLKLLIEDKTLRDQLVQNALKSVKEKFSLDSMVEKTENVYREVLSSMERSCK